MCKQRNANIFGTEEKNKNTLLTCIKGGVHVLGFAWPIGVSIDTELCVQDLCRFFFFTKFSWQNCAILISCQLFKHLLHLKIKINLYTKINTNLKLLGLLDGISVTSNQQNKTSTNTQVLAVPGNFNCGSTS